MILIKISIKKMVLSATVRRKIEVTGKPKESVTLSVTISRRRRAEGIKLKNHSRGVGSLCQVRLRGCLVEIIPSIRERKRGDGALPRSRGINQARLRRSERNCTLPMQRPGEGRRVDAVKWLS